MATNRAAQVTMNIDSCPVRASLGAITRSFGRDKEKSAGPEKQEWLPIDQRD